VCKIACSVDLKQLKCVPLYHNQRQHEGHTACLTQKHLKHPSRSASSSYLETFSRRLVEMSITPSVTTHGNAPETRTRSCQIPNHDLHRPICQCVPFFGVCASSRYLYEMRDSWMATQNIWHHCYPGQEAQRSDLAILQVRSSQASVTWHGKLFESVGFCRVSHKRASGSKLVAADRA
jgi:hypothetical protein